MLLSVQAAALLPCLSTAGAPPSMHRSRCHAPAACKPPLCRSNALAFPQDRATGYKIYTLPPPNSSVLWTQVVQGVWYQVRLLLLPHLLHPRPGPPHVPCSADL